MPVFNNILAGASGSAGGAAGYKIERSLRFNDGDSPSLSKSFGSAGDRKKWTYSAWFKRGSESQPGRFFSAGPSSTNRTNIFLYPRSSSGGIGFYSYVNGSLVGQAGSNFVLADHSAWYHLVFAFDAANSTLADRLKIYINGVEHPITYPVNVSNMDHYIGGNVAHYVGKGADGYPFDGYLADVHFVNGQALAPTDFGEFDTTTGVWNPIEFTGSHGTNGFYLDFSDNSSKSALGNDAAGSNNFTVTNLAAEASTNAVAGTHQNKVGISFNGTNASIELSSHSDLNPGSGVFTLEAYAYALSGGSAELGIYDGTTSGANGSLVIRRVGSGTIMLERANQAFDITGGQMSENSWHHVAVTRDGSNNVRLFLDGVLQGTSTNNTQNYQGHFRIGRTNNAFTNGYVSNLRLIKGSCLYTANFTPPSLPLSNVSGTTLLMAQSTSSATAATVKPSGVTISGPGDDGVGIDSLLDSPSNYDDGTNIGGNYCTLNPLDNQQGNGTLSNGNLDITQNAAAWAFYRSTMFVSSGKWYWECTIGNNQYSTIGICTDAWSMASATNAWPGEDNSMYGYYPYDGKKYNGDSGASYATADTTAAGSVIGVALDMDNGTLSFYKDGTHLGTAYTGLTGKNVSPTHWLYNQNNADSYNFGQRPFKYAPGTTGAPAATFKALCTQNLDDPLIAKGSTVFDVITSAGTGADKTFTMPGGFGPDLVWAKQRNASSNNALFDTLRGATKRLVSNSPQVEDTQANQLKTFTTTGFTYGGDIPNGSNQTGVYWCWDAGNAANPTSISVGGLNSSAYNQDQVWSTYGTFTGNHSGEYDWAGVFSAGNTYDAAGSLYLTSGTGKWTLTSSLACSSEIKIYVNGASSFTINEGLSDEKTVASTSSGFHYVVIPFSGNISSIKLNTATQYTIRIYVDGKALIDQGITLGGAGVPNYPTIASTVRANPTAGFSIVSYTGTQTAGTIGHGLNSKPSITITKSRDSADSWFVYTDATGSMKYNQLEGSGSFGNSGLTLPTSSVFYVGSSNGTNKQNDEFITYCWSPVEGYSAFGSYEGNGLADGPFVYTGFKPAWILVKNVDGTGHWVIMDSKRDADNPMEDRLKADEPDPESDTPAWDALSNGFKIRSTYGFSNTDNSTYFYAAFAENPFKISRAR